MSRSLKVGTFFGIGVYLHWTFFLLPLFVAWWNLDHGWRTAGLAALLVCIIFACVILHEYGHALTARLFGIQTRDITMYPIGGMARLERMPDDPWEEFWIAVAGPAVNVVIAGMLLVIGLAAGIPLPHPNQDLFVRSPLQIIWWGVVFGNVSLILFNLIPAFPMDGGRVLRAVLSPHFGQLRATEIAVWIARGFAVLFALPRPDAAADCFHAARRGPARIDGAPLPSRPSRPGLVRLHPRPPRRIRNPPRPARAGAGLLRLHLRPPRGRLGGMADRPTGTGDADGWLTGRLQHALGRGDAGRARVQLRGVPQSAGNRLEDAFDDVMRVAAVVADDVQV
jgi:Zn-dependent protease